MAALFVVFVALAATAQAGPLDLTIEDIMNQTVPFRGNFDEQGPYFGGDMRLSEKQLMMAKQGIQGNNYRWPGGRVPTIVDGAFTSSERNVLAQAITELHQKTCIRFVNRRSTDRDYIRIVRGRSGSGCWSYVGKQGGAQQVNLQAGNPGCIFKGIVAHELIHAIGYFHEQSRPDRDDYVSIQFQNIQSGTEHNFDKYDDGQVGTFDVDYDYGSVMHYSAYAFSKNGQPTIVATQNGNSDQMGQRNGLSDLDAQKINNMYQGICQ